MKKLYIIMIMLGIFLVGIVGAGVFSNVILPQDKVDVITGVKNSQLNLNVSDVKCDKTMCYATVYQKDVINTFWMGEKSYCSVRNTTIDKSTNKMSNDCLQYRNYTTAELESQRDNYVVNRVTTYADAITDRKTTKGATGAI